VTWGFEKAKGLARLSDNNPPHKSPPDQKVRLIDLDYFRHEMRAEI
jgi:hypothetical protein